MKETHRADFGEAPHAAMRVLNRALAPTLAARYAAELERRGDDFYFPSEWVIGSARAGKRWWANAR